MPHCATRGSLLHHTCWCFCAKAHYTDCNGKEGMTAAEPAHGTGSSQIRQGAAAELTASLGTKEHRPQTLGQEPPNAAEAEQLFACLRSQRCVTPSDPVKILCFLPSLIVQGKNEAFLFHKSLAFCSACTVQAPENRVLRRTVLCTVTGGWAGSRLQVSDSRGVTGIPSYTVSGSEGFRSEQAYYIISVVQKLCCDTDPY